MGGGNWITQSAPTNFHTFCRRKMLTNGDSMENYMEVTEERKAEIEEADALWEEPPRQFVDDVTKRGAVYNAATGYFELNGLTDITYGQMRVIHAETSVWPLMMNGSSPTVLTATGRTNYSISTNTQGGRIVSSYIPNIEVLALRSIHNSSGFSFDKYAITSKTIKRIAGEFEITTNSETSFYTCDNLEEIRVFNLKINLYLNYMPKLSNESLLYIVNKATNTSAIKIYVHSKVYARITEDIFELAASKDISIVSA